MNAIGPNKHTLTQLKDAVHDGLRAVKNALEDGSVVPGAGAFELAAYSALTSSEFMNTVKGRSKYGVKAFAEALLIIVKVLAQNSGFDPQDTIVKLLDEYNKAKQPVGINLTTGEALIPADEGIWDNYRVKRQLLHSCTTIASNLLVVDEIMKAGMSSLKSE
eukprot:Em0015g622a